MLNVVDAYHKIAIYYNKNVPECCITVSEPQTYACDEISGGGLIKTIVITFHMMSQR